MQPCPQFLMVVSNKHLEKHARSKEEHKASSSRDPEGLAMVPFSTSEVRGCFQRGLHLMHRYVC